MISTTKQPPDIPAGSENGWVVSVSLPLPSLQDNTADVDRLCRAVQQKLKTDHVGMDLDLARKMPQRLSSAGYAVTCVVAEDGNRAVLVQALPTKSRPIFAGLAVDLGTTRIVLRLMDLARGQVLSETAFDNPQIAIGPDILARIHHADRPDGSRELQHSVVESLNRHIRSLCESCDLTPEDVYLVCVAGNTTMCHLLTGLPVRSIIREPYIPVVNRFELLSASELGLNIHHRARMMIFPGAGSYLGGDIISGILFSGLNKQEGTALFVDVGTNAEVVLGNRDWLMACAGAAGPALEGGVSRIGAMAKPGIIDRVRIDPQTGEFDLHTIENLPASGICGSGFIDLAAGLFQAGMIDIRGKFRPERCNGRLSYINDHPHLTIVPGSASADGQDLAISQADMDSLIRSKAAMFTILETITTTMGMDLSQIDTFYVAGTFGSFINPRSAITIGMLPDLPVNRFQSLGNSSLGGATMALKDRSHWKSVDAIRDSITYLELNVNQDFMNRFSAAKFLPHTDPGRFPSVKIPKQ